MTRRSDDEWLDAKQKRRMIVEARAIDRLEKKEAAAGRMIGELCRAGKEVLYIYPVGGKYREGTYSELVNFLVRNSYV